MRRFTLWGSILHKTSIIMSLRTLDISLLSLFSVALVSCQTQINDGKTSLDHTVFAVGQTKAINYSIPKSAGIEQLVSEALAHHPSLEAARYKISRLQAKVPQAASLPDPKARISAGNLAETAAGRVNSVVGIEQSIPFPGKRKARASAAQKEADAVKAELGSLKLRIAERVRVAYWNYYLATRTQSINSQSKEVLKTIQEIVGSRVKANQAGQADLLRVSTEISKVDQQLIMASQQASSAKAMLNALLNRPANSSLPYPRVSSIPSSSSLNMLIAKAESSHPSIRAGQARVNVFRHRLKNAELDFFPDFMIGAQYASVSDSGLSPIANGRDQSMLTLGFTIPLWDKPRKAKIREANAGIAEMAANVSSTRAELRQRIEDAWFQTKSSREMIQIFDKRLIPDATQAYDLSLKSYSAGKQSFVDVLDTWRLLLQLQLQQENSRTALGKASAALKSAAAIK